MTKYIRVENADTGTKFTAVVQVWDKGAAGVTGEVPPDTMAKEYPLGYPTAMLEEYITSTRYLVVKEKEVAPVPLNETKTYSDGTVATGPGPLPELSPAQQDAKDALCSAIARSLMRSEGEPVPEDQSNG